MAAGFLGADITYSPDANMQLYLGGEGAIESEGDTVIQGRAGGSIKF